MANDVCRIGILGTANIARKNWKAAKLAGNARIAAVGSRSMDSAKRFIAECQSQVPQVSEPIAFGSYEEMLDSDAIDAVYIPLPTALRYDWVVRAAQAGKHVLGEKPAAASAEKVAHMLEVCRDRKVQYMDGVMFMHSQRMAALREQLDGPACLGQLKRMASQFSFAGDAAFRESNIRTNSELEPFGCLGDLGWYCLRFFLWAMRGEMPTEVRCRTLSSLQANGSPSGVPGEFSGELLFPSGVTASFYCSFVTENQQWLHLSGTEGYLRIDDFVLPYCDSEVGFTCGRDFFNIDNCEFHMEKHQVRHAVREYDAGQATAQEVRMIRQFASLVLSRELDATWPEWTLKTQRVLDACFHSAAADGARVQLAS